MMRWSLDKPGTLLVDSRLLVAVGFVIVLCLSAMLWLLVAFVMWKLAA